MRDRHDPWSELEYHYNKAHELEQRFQTLSGPDTLLERRALQERIKVHTREAHRLQSKIKNLHE